MYADGDPYLDRRRRIGDQGLRERMNRRRSPEEGGEGFARPDMQPMHQGQVIGQVIPDAQGNIDIWAHDETAQPGLTYRYRLRVVIKNPIYDVPNMSPEPKLMQIAYLPANPKTGELDPEASWSEWTKSVAIPTNVDMRLVNASNLGGRESAQFEVRRFQEGQINEAPKPFVVVPGDTIGGVEKVQIPGVQGAPAVTKQIDFSTNWTVVDIRSAGSNDYRVRIMDPQGRIEVRTVSGDTRRFKDAAKPAAPNANVVGLVRPN